MRDLLSRSCARAIESRLSAIAQHVQEHQLKLNIINFVGVVDPQKTIDGLSELRVEIDDAIREAIVELACEAERRKPKTDDPSSACVGETTDQIAARGSKPKLYDPDTDAFTDPVGSGIVGKPVPQSDRTGA